MLLPKKELSSSIVVEIQGSESMSFNGVGFVSLPNIWSKAKFVYVVSSKPGVTCLSKKSMPVDL